MKSNILAEENSETVLGQRFFRGFYKVLSLLFSWTSSFSRILYISLECIFVDNEDFSVKLRIYKLSKALDSRGLYFAKSINKRDLVSPVLCYRQSKA